MYTHVHAIYAHRHTKTNHIYTHSKAWIGTLGWPCAALQTINGPIKKWAIKHAVIGFIASEGTSGKKARKRERDTHRERCVCVCVFDAKRKGKKTFMHQVKSQNTNRVNYHKPFTGVCFLLWSSLGWHCCVFCLCLCPDWVCAHVHVFVCV